MTMTISQPDIVLFSSNRRRRYAEDVLAALALPSGALIQFRYGSGYLAPKVRDLVQTGGIVGKRVLVAFIGEPDGPTRFILPVRFASVMSADQAADVFLFRLRVDHFPNVEGYSLDTAQLQTRSADLYDRLVERNGTYFPAVASFPDMHVEGPGDPPQLWLGIARRLALHPTFRASYFMRVDAPVLHAGQTTNFDAAGRLSLVDQQSAKIPVSFYSTEYSDDAKRTLRCVTDGTFLKISSDDEYDVALRYDTVEFWLQPTAPNFEALARVSLSLDTDGPDSERMPAPTARFPVLVRRSRPRLAGRILSVALGAFLVALPAILGQQSSLELRVVSAVVGAALLAFATVFLGRTGDR